MSESTTKINGYTISIEQDTDPINPRREWDNFGTMTCLHKRYTLGDTSDIDREELDEIIADKNTISLPIYMYDHSGITVSTTPFNDRFDSGKLGYIYVTKEQIRKEYKVKRISKKILEKVYALLKAEVKTYDDYLTGNVYGYTVTDPSGNEIASCWGFFGDDEEYILNEAKSYIPAIAA